MIKGINRTLVVLMGVTAILWGIYFSYKIYLVTQSKDWLDWIKSLASKTGIQGELPFYADWVNLVSPYLIGGMFIISGLSLIRLKPWSGSFYLITLSLFTYISLGCLFLAIGWYGNEIHFVIVFSMYLLSVVVLFHKPIADKFPLRIWMPVPFAGKPLFRKIQLVRLRYMILFSVGIVGFAVVSYVVIWFETGIDKYPALKQTTFEMKKEINYAENYYYPDLPYPISFAMPNKTQFFVFGGSDKSDETSLLIKFPCQSKNYCYFPIDTSRNLETIRDLASKVGQKTSYQGLKKIFAERVGLYHTLLLQVFLLHEGDRLWESQINNYKVFIAETFTSSNKRKEKLPTTTVFIFENERLIAKVDSILQELYEIRPIMATIRPQVPKQPAEYYQNGLKHMEAGELYQAKASFASALYFDWENPDYQFAMAQAHVELKSFINAAKKLKNALELRPDFPEAKELLRVVNEKDLQKK